MQLARLVFGVYIYYSQLLLVFFFINSYKKRKKILPLINKKNRNYLFLRILIEILPLSKL